MCNGVAAGQQRFRNLTNSHLCMHAHIQMGASAERVANFLAFPNKGEWDK